MRGTLDSCSDRAADIQYFSGGTRASSVKETGPPLIGQTWKEGLRESYAQPPTGREAELENLRSMLHRAAGERLPLFDY